MKTLYLFLFAIIFSIPTLNARKIKTKHTLPKQSELSIKADVPDSILSLSSDSLIFVEKIRPSIRFYGFDKTVTSNLESFFISNALDSEISGMEIQLTYFDMKGRQLHKRTATLNVKVPPHETLRTDIKTWDTQKSFYYHKSAKPKRQATPFSVKIDLLSLTFIP
ncbi:MAG: hypothetical protein K2N35_14350 [Muribaculaceae bacterium]|nr:hypothetical protein [Muribaculaceae bacterium]